MVQDLKNPIELLAQQPLGANEHYIPSTEIDTWIGELIHCPRREKDPLLSLLTAKAHEFVGEMRHVMRNGDQIIVEVPRNFTFDTYLGKEMLSLKY